MHTIKLYRDVSEGISRVWKVIENIILSKWGVIIFLINYWFDGPAWFRRLVRHHVVLLGENLIRAPIFADRSKTLYTRFVEKRKRKLAAIYIGFCELYTMQIITWRKTVIYYRREPWLKMFWILTSGFIAYYITEYMFIYNSIRVLRMHTADNVLQSNYPNRVAGHKRIRWFNRFYRRWRKVIQIKEPRDIRFKWLLCRMHGYWARDLNYQYSYNYFPSRSFFLMHPIWIYLFITIYYYFTIWYYHEEFYFYMYMIFYALSDDWYKVVEDDDVPGGDTVIIIWSRRFVTWLTCIKYKVDLRSCFSWDKEVFGKLYDFNTQFLRNQKYRRWYWLHYMTTWDEMIPKIKPPIYHSEPTDREIFDYEEKEDEDRRVWNENYNKRRLKNRWPITAVRDWWVSRQSKKDV